MNWREAPATVAIALVTVLVSVAIILTGRVGIAAVTAGFIPALASGAHLPIDSDMTPLPFWLTPLTTTLLHAGFAHLILNMVIFAFCGRLTEGALGSKGLIVLYGVGAYAAAFGQWLAAPHSPVPMIGASGAISAVIAAYALLFGTQSVRALGPLPARLVHALWLAAAWIGIQMLIGISGLAANGMTIAIAAHIGGFLIGLLLTRPLLRLRFRGA